MKLTDVSTTKVDDVPTVAAAQEQLERAPAKEKELRAEAQRVEREHKRALLDLEKRTEPAVADLERRARDVLTALKDAPSGVHLGARQLLRGYLHGQLAAPELERPEHAVARQDPTCGSLLGVCAAAGQLLAGNVTQDAWLTADHPLVARIDKLEVAVWSAFAARVRLLAGE